MLVKKKSSWKKKAAIGAVVAGVGIAGHFTGRHVFRKIAAIRTARRAETKAVRESIVKSRLPIDPNVWTPVCRIYKFDLADAKTKGFITSVEGFCAKKGLSLKRFFETVELNKISNEQIRALETANRSYSKQITGFELTANTKKGRERRFALSQIKNLNPRIERNKRIQAVIELCLKYPKQVDTIQGTRGSLSKVRKLP